MEAPGGLHTLWFHNNEAAAAAMAALLSTMNDEGAQLDEHLGDDEPEVIGIQSQVRMPAVQVNAQLQLHSTDDRWGEPDPRFNFTPASRFNEVIAPGANEATTPPRVADEWLPSGLPVKTDQTLIPRYLYNSATSALMGVHLLYVKPGQKPLSVGDGRGLRWVRFTPAVAGVADAWTTVGRVAPGGDVALDAAKQYVCLGGVIASRDATDLLIAGRLRTPEWGGLRPGIRAVDTFLGERELATIWPYGMPYHGKQSLSVEVYAEAAAAAADIRVALLFNELPSAEAGGDQRPPAKHQNLGVVQGFGAASIGRGMAGGMRSLFG